MKRKILYCTVLTPLSEFERRFYDKTGVQLQSIPSDFGIPLVALVGKLLRVGVVLADGDEVDLQLKLSVGFVSQGQADRIHLSK